MGDKGIAEGDTTFIPMGVDLCGYSQNNEWDIINVTARRKQKFYVCCPGLPYPDITFNVTIRRKTLFYTVNLILPIVAISCLTVLVFYLPSDSGEKITLSISILLTLTVFFLLLSDINPPTSLVIPLLGKYLLFTMIVVSMSIFLTVYTLSVHFRSPSTHVMTPWMRRVYTEILPRILCMERPQLKKQATETVQISSDTGTEEGPKKKKPVVETKITVPNVPAPMHYENLHPDIGAESTQQSEMMVDVMKSIRFIANHLKDGDEVQKVTRDWNYVAMVMDRLFLFIFTTACLCGTIGIFLNAPALFDPREPMDRICLY